LGERLFHREEAKGAKGAKKANCLLFPRYLRFLRFFAVKKRPNVLCFDLAAFLPLQFQSQDF
jgi:hypothetical protein